MALCATMNLTSCSSDDDPQKELQKVLSKKHYRLRKAGQVHLKTVSLRTLLTTQVQDYPTYYAFSFENGVCNDAVYNVICDDETEASYICNMLNNGTFDDLESDDYSYQG